MVVILDEVGGATRRPTVRLRKRKTIRADVSIIRVSPIKRPLRQHILVYSHSTRVSATHRKLSACFEWEVNEKKPIPES
jgi:hypothetical protein